MIENKLISDIKNFKKFTTYESSLRRLLKDMTPQNGKVNQEEEDMDFKEQQIPRIDLDRSWLVFNMCSHCR